VKFDRFAKKKMRRIARSLRLRLPLQDDIARLRLQMKSKLRGKNWRVE